MAAQVSRGRVILRRWSQRAGLDERAVDFATLDDLFALCLQTADSLLVDRVIIEGRDARGDERIVTLAFQSVTVTRVEDRGAADVRES